MCILKRIWNVVSIFNTLHIVRQIELGVHKSRRFLSMKKTRIGLAYDWSEAVKCSEHSRHQPEILSNTNAHAHAHNVRLYVRVLWLNRFNPSHEYGLKTRNAAT